MGAACSPCNPRKQLLGEQRLWSLYWLLPPAASSLGSPASEGSDPEEWRHLAVLEACVCSEQAVPHTADSSVAVGTGWSLGRDATMNCDQALRSLQDKFIPQSYRSCLWRGCQVPGTNQYTALAGLEFTIPPTQPPCTTGVNHCTYCKNPRLGGRQKTNTDSKMKKNLERPGL